MMTPTPTFPIRNFPKIPTPLIDRTNAAESIGMMFDRGIRVVVVEGPDGIGATTFMAQVAMLDPLSTVALFINASSPHGYDLDYLRLQIFEQVHWLIEAKRPKEQPVDEGDLRKAFYRLQRVFNGKRVTFVIDGLAHIPDESIDIAKYLVSQALPLAFPEFSFVISGSEQLIKSFVPSIVSTKSIPLLAFTISETSVYLDDIVKAPADIAAIRKVTQGIPGRLASVKRLLIEGYPLEQILEGDKTDELDFIQLECKGIESASKEARLVAAAVAFAKQPVTTQILAFAFGVTEESVHQALQDLKAVEILGNGEVVFLSQAHRNYLRKALGALQYEAFEALLRSTQASSTTDENIVVASEYLTELGRDNDLLALLDSERLEMLLGRTTSMRSAEHAISIGVDAAARASRLMDLLRLGGVSSILRGIGPIGPLRQELSARMRLGQAEQALTLALRAPLAENRLALLSLFARLQHELMGSVEAGITEQISQLLNECDLADNQELASEIASDLWPVSPEIALEAVEKTRAPGAEAEIDAIYAAIAISKGRSSKESTESLNGRALAKISDKELQTFAQSVGLQLSTVSPDEVIKRAQALDGKYGIYLLTSWTRANQKHEGAAKVIAEAISRILSDTAYSPTISDFRDLALPLRYLANEDEIKELVRRFDGQKATAKARSSMEDLVRFELLLAEAELRFSFQAAEKRIIDLYFEIFEADNEANRCGALAWLIARAQEIDSNGRLEKETGILSDARRWFDLSLEKVLHGTGEQLAVCDSAMRAFGRVDVAQAVSIARRLNMERRRDIALMRIARLYVDFAKPGMDVHAWTMAVEAISDPDLKERSVLSALEGLLERSGDDLKAMGDLSSSLDLALQLTIPDIAGNACLAAIELSHRVPSSSDDELRGKLLKKFENVLGDVDPQGLRLSLMFSAARVLAPNRKEIAERFIDQAVDLRRNLVSASEDTQSVLFSCADLASRAAVPLITHGLYADDDLKELDQLFLSLDSVEDYCTLWAQIAVWAHFGGRASVTGKVVSDYLRPTYASMATHGKEVIDRLYPEIAPALYLFHPISAISELEKLPRHLAESAAVNICNVLLRRMPQREPYDEDRGAAFTLSYQSALDILAVAKYVSSDARVFWVVETICTSIADASRNKFNREQADDIAEKLRAFWLGKLPDPNNIAHEGYTLLCEAKVLTLLRSYDEARWRALLQRAAQIQNYSDAVYCLSYVGSMLPLKGVELKAVAQRGAMELLMKIPSDIDRCDRLEDMSSIYAKSDGKFARECIRKAFDMAELLGDSREGVKRQQRIIELMYGIDEALAKAYVQKLDDDPVKKDIRRVVAPHAKKIELKRALEKKPDIGNLGRADQRALPDFAWSRLGALNAGVALALPMDDMRQWALAASRLEINAAYPIISWLVQSAVVRLTSIDDVQRYFTPAFQAFAALTRLAALLSRRLSASRADVAEKAEWSSKSGVISPGDRERAKQLIVEWVGKHSNASRIRLVDPYFGPRDMWFIKTALQAAPHGEITILTSKVQVTRPNISIDEVFNSAWNDYAKDLDATGVEIVVTYYADSNDTPIHDRWLFADKDGLRLGTSINSIGETKISEISEMNVDESVAVQGRLADYFSRRRRQEGGRALRFTVVGL